MPLDELLSERLIDIQMRSHIQHAALSPMVIQRRARPQATIIFLIVLSVSSCSSHTNKAQTNNQNYSLSCPTQFAAIETKQSILDSTQQAIGKRFVRVTHNIDSFLSNKTIEPKINNSYLLLTIQGTNFREQSNEADISLNAKLDLPNTKERFKIFFDSVLDEQQSVEQRASAVSSGEVVKSDQSTAGLEYQKKTDANQWRKGIKVGLTTSSLFQTFIRYRLSKSWHIFKDTQLDVKQDFWYLDGTGWGETTQIDIESPLSPDSYLLFSTDIEFEQEERPITYSQFVSIYTSISDKQAINYRIGAIGSNDESGLIDSYLANIHFIRRLRGDWLLASVIPELIVRNERDWYPEPSITLKFDFFFK